MKHIIRSIECLKNDNTNCYDNSSLIIGNKNYIDIYDFDNFINIVRMNINVDVNFIYIISMTNQIFNHSFSVIQCQNLFSICDSWEGNRRLSCSPIMNWSNFHNFLKKCNKFFEENDYQIYDLFTNNDLDSDLGYLKSIGSWTTSWNDIKKKSDYRYKRKTKLQIKIIVAT